jgi:hypothetical protein
MSSPCHRASSALDHIRIRRELRTQPTNTVVKAVHSRTSNRCTTPHPTHQHKPNRCTTPHTHAAHSLTTHHERATTHLRAARNESSGSLEPFPSPQFDEPPPFHRWHGSSQPYELSVHCESFRTHAHTSCGWRKSWMWCGARVYPYVCACVCVLLAS